MSRKFWKNLVSLVLAVMLVYCSFAPALADDTLYVGAWHDYSDFSFTDYTLSSVKTVEGQYLTIRIDFHKPSWDAGIGDIKLKFEIRDAYTGQAITGQYLVGTTGSTVVSQTYYSINLGYTGRKVRFWFDASSAGQSNGYFRSATVDVFTIYVQ